MRLSRRSFAITAATSPFLIPGVAYGQSTPTSSQAFEPASSRATRLMEYAPAVAALSDSFGVVWIDVERHLASVREPAQRATEEYEEDQLAFMSLYSGGSPLIEWAFDLEMLAGYNFAQVRETLEFGVPPEIGMLVGLQMPAESLIPFWVSNDYQLIEREFGEFWSLDEEPSLSFDNPIQRAMMARMNNVAILEEDLIVYAASSDLMEHIMSAVAGESFNMTKSLGGLVSGFPEDATSSWFVDGGMLGYESVVAPLALQNQRLLEEADELMAESDDAVGRMPMISTLGVGAEEGGHRLEEIHNPDSREFMVLHTSRFNMAEQAAKVIDWRVKNMFSVIRGEPYIEQLPDLEFDVISGEILRISQPLSIPLAILPRLLVNRDVLPFTFRVGQ